MVVMCAGIMTGCLGATRDNGPQASPEPTEAPAAPTPTPTPELTPPPPPEPIPVPVNLVPYSGNPEHLFFHEVIAYPELAFPNRRNPYNLDDYMLTVHEFSMVLENLYQKNYVLVSMHDVWEEFINAEGQVRMRRKDPFLVPEGKIPIVLSFDDLTFHLEPFNAFMHRYIIGPDGDVWAEGIDPSGNPIVTQDLTAITILDKFIRENPDFSHNGARGCIAQTGLYGILGYATQTSRTDDSPEFRMNRRQEIARAEPVIKKVTENGWYWASHSWGHMRFETASLERIRTDAERWNNEVASLVGDTIIMIYGHGSRLDGNDVSQTAGPALRFYVNELGFRMFASVGRENYVQIRRDLPAVMMDRMAVDGITLRSVVATTAYARHLKFYSARDVFDPLRPEGPTNWG